MYTNQSRIFLFTWSMNMIIVSLIGFFPKYEPYLYLRGYFNILVLIYLWKDIRLKDPASKYIMIFMVYLFILCLFSSNIRLSLTMTVKTSIGMLVYMLAQRFFGGSGQFNKLLGYYKYLFILLLLTIVLSNLLGIGQTGYGEDPSAEESVFFGSIGVNITKLLIIPILIAPVYLYNIKGKLNKAISIILILIGIIITIIAFKRSSTLGLIGGALVYALLMKKSKIVKPLIYIVIIAYFSFPLYKDYLFNSFEARKGQLYYVSKEAESMEKEARYWETANVLNALKEDDLIHTFFGSEIFNEFDYFNVVRMLHIDYNVILNGSGIIGLFLFLIIYYYIIKKAWFYRRKAKDEQTRLISISVISIIVYAMFMSIGGSVRAFDFRGPVFIYAGAALGFLESEFIKSRLAQNESATQYNPAENISNTTNKSFETI
jgi:hypothetical protein